MSRNEMPSDMPLSLADETDEHMIENNVSLLLIRRHLEELTEEFSRYRVYAASTSAIHSLKVESVTSSIKDKIESICSICLDEFQLDDKIIFMPCNHVFHKQCLLRWLQKSNKCPYCKYEIELNKDNYELPQEVREFMSSNFN